MTMAIPSRGRHTPAHQTLRTQLREAEADNRQLIADNETLVCDLTRAVVRSCGDAIRIAQLEKELAAVKGANEDLQRKTIRAQAEQERLRRAVVAARPRIREVDTQLVRPYSPVAVLPYVSPVPYRDTSTDATQQLPVIDRPV